MHYTVVLNPKPVAGVGAILWAWLAVIGSPARVSRTFCHAPLSSPTMTDRSQSQRGWALQWKMESRIIVSGGKYTGQPPPRRGKIRVRMQYHMVWIPPAGTSCTALHFSDIVGLQRLSSIGSRQLWCGLGVSPRGTDSSCPDWGRDFRHGELWRSSIPVVHGLVSSQKSISRTMSRYIAYKT